MLIKLKTNFSENRQQLKLIIMKTKIGILILALSASCFSLQAQRTVTTTRALSNDISDNLDLDAVASIFGDSENLEDFEYRLNDPDNRISNLDLNQDGYTDYLRVVENSSDQNSLVVVQAVLDEDIFQDVATIEIEKTNNGNPRVQIVGDSYIYGSNYIIEPVFVQRPVIFSFFWSPRYVTYQSPYYWNSYPGWYSHCRPYSPYRYQRNVNLYVNRYNTYNHTTTRNFQISGDRHNHIRRNDFATKHPDRAFENRHEGLKNRSELLERRPTSSVNHQRSNDIQRSNNRQLEHNRQSNTGINDHQKNVNQNRRSGSNVQSGSNSTTRTRENSHIDNNRNSPASSNKAAHIKSANRNEGSSVTRNRSISTPNSSPNRVQVTQRNSDSRSQSISKPAPDRASTRVQSAQRSSAPREKSGSVSRNNGSNSQVKQASPSLRKPESQNGNDKKETGNSRRR